MDIFENQLIYTLGTGVFLVLFVGVIIFKSLYWLYLWQLKEYRTDRMLDFLTTRSGRKATSNVWNGGEFLFLLIFIYENVSGSQDVVVLLSLIFFVFFLALEAAAFSKNRIFPVWTKKAILLAVGSIGLLMAGSGVLLLGPVREQIIVASAIILSPVLVSVVVLILQPFVAIQKQRIIRQAKEKINRLQPVVIGITGSYGKSTTKEFLKSLLEQNFSVLATPKNINVDIGVAQTILDNLTSDHDIFIVEMGAYKMGEIDAICDLVSPIIGVLTAINEQHFALFGNLEAIKNTKAELIESLPSSGVAVINRDNNSCYEVSERTHAKRKFFSTQEVAHVYASDIIVRPQSLDFSLHVGTSKVDVSSPLHGRQSIPSILAAAVVADHLGMSLDGIKRGIERLEPVAGTMQLKNGRNHYYVIDDSYNANPDGFMAAIDYLERFSGKRKIVITPGMQELGASTDQHHRNVGSRAGSAADMLIITKKDFATPLHDSAKTGGMQDQDIVIDDRPARLIKSVLSDFTSSDVVLVEGRVHPSIRAYLLGS